MTEFHIHVDAQSLEPSLEQGLVERLGFLETNFCGHPKGIQHSEPNHHLTLKCYSGRDFRKRFEEAVAMLSSSSMRGYLEGEVVASDVVIPEKEVDARVQSPFQVDLRQLDPGSFRETEIHITMDRDRSDPRLIEALCGTGMFAAYLPKRYGTALVFTAQGSRPIISQLLPIITDYLRKAGGAASCSVKEERVLRWWLSHGDVVLPPVVHRLCVAT